jgi:hypothetical protein
MRKTIFFLTVIALYSFDHCRGQDNELIDQTVYLIGNTATREFNTTNLASLHDYVSKEVNPFTILHPGDITNPDQPDEWTGDLHILYNLSNGGNHGRMLFVPGDKDWNNSGRDGLKMVREVDFTSRRSPVITCLVYSLSLPLRRNCFSGLDLDLCWTINPAVPALHIPGAYPSFPLRRGDPMLLP